MDAVVEGMTQFMLAFTGESSPVDDVPFERPLWLVRAAASELVDERANRRPPLPGRGK